MIYEHDDPRAYDANGILRDGATIRVPQYFRDAMRSGLSHSGDFHRPGFVTADANTAAADARREWIASMTDAWKGDASPPAGAHAGEGTSCTITDKVDARPPPRFMDVAAAEEIRRQAYEEYVARLCDEWRVP
jgi:hypothetical protein